MKTTLGILAVALFAVADGAAAQTGGERAGEPLTRVLLSSEGKDDSNCGEKKPCRTLQAAFAKVAAGGEVVFADSGPFAGTAITKSMTITAVAGVTAIHLQWPGLSITADPADAVLLRDLDLKGDSGVIGIQILTARSLHLDRCVFSGFGIAIGATGGVTGGMPGGTVTATHSTFRNNQTAIDAQTSTLDAVSRVALSDCSFESNGIGVAVTNNASATATRCMFSDNDTALLAHPGAGNKARLQIDQCQISNNNTGVMANTNGGDSLTTLASSTISGNRTGVAIYGVLQSLGNNMISGNRYWDVLGNPITPLAPR